MKKLNKMYYYTKDGEKKLNCYYVAIPKQIVEEAELENKEVMIRTKNGQIIIESK